MESIFNLKKKRGENMPSNTQILLLLLGLCAVFFAAGWMWGAEVKEYQIFKNKKVKHVDFRA